MKYLMALDAGSGNCRSILFNFDGQEVCSASREWLHPTLPEYPGSQVFDTEQNWMLLCESIRESLQKAEISPHDIASVSATSMRYGSVLYDGEGKELWAAPNTDSRSNEQVTETIQKGYFDKFYRITGDGFGLCDLMRWMWVKDSLPEVWKKVRHFTPISDWILYRLTAQFVSDLSSATTTGLFDISRKSWSEELAGLFGIPLVFCTEVRESGTIIGEVHADAARQTGLKKGTPVVIGGGDTMTGLVGTGGVKNGISTVIGGTHWQQTYLSEKPVIDPEARIRVSPHIVSKLWMFETNSVFIGLTMRWFRDAFCQPEKSIAEAMGVDAYNVMERLAEKAPAGCNGLIALFANLFNARNWVHGASAFMQFDVTAPHKFGKREFIRKIEEDAAFQSLGNLSNIWGAAGHKASNSTEIVFAGGAARGFLWPQILADVMGIRIKVPVVKEATALGTAICAGVGVGAYQSISEGARTLVKWEREYTPNPENHCTYTNLYTRWRDLYQHELKIMSEGLLQPIWRAAGT